MVVGLILSLHHPLKVDYVLLHALQYITCHLFLIIYHLRIDYGCIDRICFVGTEAREGCEAMLLEPSRLTDTTTDSITS